LTYIISKPEESRSDHMSKKLIIIVAVLIIIAGGITAFLLSRPVKQPEEEELLFSDEWLAAEDLKETTLTFCFDAQKHNDMEEVLQAVNRKLRKDLNTELKFEVNWEYPAVFMDRIRQDNASGQPCDAYYFSSYFGIPMKPLADEGLMMDISELFPRYASNYYRQFSEDEIKALSVDGGIYLMEKYSIPEIKSYDDFEVYLETVKKNEPDLITLNYYDTSLGLFANAYGYAVLDREMQLVYKWDDPKMKIIAWEQTPECLESLERLNSWIEKGYLSKAYVIAQIDDKMVTSGKWASFISHPSDQIFFNLSLNNKGIKDFSYKAYPLYDGAVSRESLMTSGLVINGKSKQAQRVLMFIDWLQSDQENYDLLMYGVNGTHYIDKGDYIEPPAGETAAFFEWFWKSPFENIGRQRSSYPGLQNEIKAYQEIIDKRAIFPPHFGFTPDYSPVIQTASLRKQFAYELENIAYRGPFSEIRVQEYRDDQIKQGLDGLINEIQRQLDEYISKNH
jgi:putative aldouronate transport system substrate-binding protein